jgi:hypothetical protein
MQALFPFEKTDSSSAATESATDSVAAELTLEGSFLTFEFRPQFTSAVLGLPTINIHETKNTLRREDGLWQTTCFEAFLQPVGQADYYEFNFSFKPAWNCYEFKKYRDPQPPRPSEAFALKDFAWDAQKKALTVQLENKTPYSTFRASLTAVIETSDRRKHYWATHHSESKPDFHAANSFVLLRKKQT